MAAASSSAGGNNPPSAGAPEPGATLSAIREMVQAQVPQSAERDRVLDALAQLVSGVNQKGVRVLAAHWDVQQKASGKNRGTADIRKEVEENVRTAAMQLFQKEEHVVLSEPTSVAVVLPEPTTGASAARSANEKLAQRLGKRPAAADCASGAQDGKKRRVPGAAPDGAPLGKRKAKGPAGEDSCTEEPTVAPKNRSTGADSSGGKEGRSTGTGTADSSGGKEGSSTGTGTVDSSGGKERSSTGTVDSGGKERRSKGTTDPSGGRGRRSKGTADRGGKSNKDTVDSSGGNGVGSGSTGRADRSRSGGKAARKARKERRTTPRAPSTDSDPPVVTLRSAERTHSVYVRSNVVSQCTTDTHRPFWL